MNRIKLKKALSILDEKIEELKEYSEFSDVNLTRILGLLNSTSNNLSSG